MSPSTTVHLLRHGEVHNPDGVLYGRLPDFHLSERGQLMAQRAAAALANRDIAVVTASPLDRAQETAAPIGPSCLSARVLANPPSPCGRNSTPTKVAYLAL